MSENFQDNCIFCKIAQGEIPCTRLLETETVLVFLDISPVNKGHALIVPKYHAETIFDLPDTYGTELLSVMKRVGGALLLATGAGGMNVIQNNYPVAGQQVPHVHWHLIPRHEGDGHTAWAQGTYSGVDEVTALAQAIREHLS